VDGKNGQGQTPPRSTIQIRDLGMAIHLLASESPASPFFLKFRGSVYGPGATVTAPRYSWTSNIPQGTDYQYTTLNVCMRCTFPAPLGQDFFMSVRFFQYFFLSLITQMIHHNPTALKSVCITTSECYPNAKLWKYLVPYEFFSTGWQQGLRES